MALPERRRADISQRPFEKVFVRPRKGMPPQKDGRRSAHGRINPKNNHFGGCFHCASFRGYASVRVSRSVPVRESSRWRAKATAAPSRAR